MEKFSSGVEVLRIAFVTPHFSTDTSAAGCGGFKGLRVSLLKSLLGVVGCLAECDKKFPLRLRYVACS